LTYPPSRGRKGLSEQAKREAKAQLHAEAPAQLVDNHVDRQVARWRRELARLVKEVVEGAKRKKKKAE
jgi:hypothetical protein